MMVIKRPFYNQVKRIFQNNSPSHASLSANTSKLGTWCLLLYFEPNQVFPVCFVTWYLGSHAHQCARSIAVYVIGEKKVYFSRVKLLVGEKLSHLKKIGHLSLTKFYTSQVSQKIFYSREILFRKQKINWRPGQLVHQN